MQDEYGSFDNFIWNFVDSKPKQNSWKLLSELPAHTPDSDDHIIFQRLRDETPYVIKYASSAESVVSFRLGEATKVVV